MGETDQPAPTIESDERLVRSWHRAMRRWLWVAVLAGACTGGWFSVYWSTHPAMALIGGILLAAVCVGVLWLRQRVAARGLEQVRAAQVRIDSFRSWERMQQSGRTAGR